MSSFIVTNLLGYFKRITQSQPISFVDSEKHRTLCREIYKRGGASAILPAGETITQT